MINFVRPRAQLSYALAGATLSALLAACGSDSDGSTGTQAVRPLADRVLVVGHRGASALRPEHTLASYQKAIEDGADVIEPDLVSTRDGVLVARHENEISGTTNVAEVAQYASRRTTKTVDGVSITGWFTEDFTLAELKQLRARERIAAQRPANVQYNDQFQIPTLQEVIALARDASARTGRTIGLYPETKHPTYFASIGLPMEERLVAALRADAFTASQASVFIQSFETANLKAVRARIGASQPNWRLVQLMDEASARPFDFTAAGDRRTYGDLMTAAGMREVSTYADAVGPFKRSILDVNAAGNFRVPSDLVKNAHDARLLVHPYTFRPENAFLPAPLKASGADSTRNPAGSIAEIQAYLRAGIDGFFTDDPAIGRQAVDTLR